MTAKDAETADLSNIPIRVLIVDDDEAHAQAVRFIVSLLARWQESSQS